MNKGEKINFYLPFSLQEKGCDSKLFRKGKHFNEYREILTLLISFDQFAKDLIEKFYLVCPNNQVDEILLIIEPYVSSLKIEIIEEESLIGNSDLIKNSNNFDLKGWYIQQILKICGAKLFRNDQYYCTLDSDIFLIKKLEYNDLFSNGKPFLSLESIADYERIYKPELAAKETATKVNRNKKSLEILKIKSENRFSYFYGETPVFLHSGSALALIEHLEKIYPDGWIDALMKNPGWTEYSLYFSFLDFRRSTDTLYNKADINKIIGLENSIYHESKLYRIERSFDCIFSDKIDYGPFRVVQSWISPEDWLHQMSESKQSFYEELNKIIMNI